MTTFKKKRKNKNRPKIESFFGHYKTEEVYRSNYTTLAEGQVGWSLYRIWYETERVHESLGYQTPQQRLVLASAENGADDGGNMPVGLQERVS